MTTLDHVVGEVATPEFEHANEQLKRRRGFLMALPAYAYLVVFFALPLVFVVIYSFATRNRFGGTDLAGWNLDSYQRLFTDDLVGTILARSLWLALLTTVICLVIAYPFAYYMSTRPESVRNLMLVFVMIPFWTNFLVRNYAWRVILGTDGPLSQTTEFLGLGPQKYLFTSTAIVLGMVYGFLPFMVLPLYAAIERIDHGLLEAARDLYGTGVQSFRHVLLPLSMPGVIAGSILVFVPSLGAYVTPEILGGAKTKLLGSHIVTQFLEARNWPFGAALSFVLMAVMLATTIIYFRKGGRTL
ncbi:MAG: ABC transporter permease [Acidimicrobiales bacterium]|nr:ABC transporter permease [Acidimicrobiales bacterium]RZV44870.1 MAG: ABC transporter permease [Acidimicrobiales bacterium]